MKLEIDHFAVSCETLSQGVEYVEDTLGVRLKTLGNHLKMGTHNRLLSLGPEIYLEVISIDPSAPKPDYPRWFDLDVFAGEPRLTNWICRTNNLNDAIANSPAGVGNPMAFERGAYRWEMAVPSNGKLPYQGGFPALIQWHGDAHPAPDLEDFGCRLLQATISHPNVQSLKASCAELIAIEKVQFCFGKEPAIELTIATPNGERTLK